jgi:hypothetical protein
MSLTNQHLKAIEIATSKFMDQPSIKDLCSANVLDQSLALQSLLQDSRDVNAERPVKTFHDWGVLDKALCNFERMLRAFGWTEGVPSEAREVIIDTFFVKTVMLARDMFQTKLGGSGNATDVAIMEYCAGIFDEGMKREIKQSSKWKPWCEELSDLAYGVIVFESTSEEISDKCFSLNSMNKEEAKEFEILKDNPRDHLLKAYEEVLQRYNWLDFARKEDPLDEAGPDSVKPEGSSSGGSARTGSTSRRPSIASGSEPPLSIETQIPSMHIVSNKQSETSHQGPQV